MVLVPRASRTEAKRRTESCTDIPTSDLGLMSLLGLAALFHVVDIKRVDELLEHGQLLFVDRRALFLAGSALDFGFIFAVEHHTCALEHALFHEDWHFP